MHEILLSDGVIGGIHDNEQLHQFGRLQIEHPERKPAPCAIDSLPDPGNQHQHEQKQCNDKQKWRIFLPCIDPDAENHQSSHQSQHNENGLTDKKVLVPVTGILRRIRQSNGCGVNHDQPEKQQCQYSEYQVLVKPHHLGIFGGGSPFPCGLRYASEKTLYRLQVHDVAPPPAAPPSRRTWVTNTSER